MPRAANSTAVVALASALQALAWMPAICAAEGPGPGQGNPLDTLPKLNQIPPQPVTVDIRQPEVSPALQQLLAKRIVPASFQIAGVKALPFESIAAQFTPLANRDVSIAEILQAAEQVTKMYQAAGYPLSFAFVPAQSFTDNIVVINVVEGYVEQIRINGNPGASEDRLRAVAEQLRSDRPLRQSTFERVTGILGLQPGMRIAATVQPPTTTDGAAEMVLEVKRKPITAALSLDTATSHLRVIGGVTENGVLGLGEQISVSALIPTGNSGEQYYAANYAQPIGQDGWLAQLNFSSYKSNPDNADLVPLQFASSYHSKTQRIGANLSYPLILSNRENLTVSGGMYAADNSNRYDRTVPAIDPVLEVRSNVRVLSIEASWVKAGEKSTTQLSGGIFKGFNGAGASVNNSNVDLDFVRLRSQFSYALQLPADFGIKLSGIGQYSSNILATSEQIGFGASMFGLAYPAGEIAGDKGWGLALELNHAFTIDSTYLKRVQPYLMADSSRAYSNAGPLTHDQLASLGLGVRLSDQRYYVLDLAIAQPVGNLPFNASSRSPRVNLTYSYQFD